MKMGDASAIGRGLLIAALAFAAGAAPAAAQSTDDCRCVDRDGNAIERCTCFRGPNVHALVPSFGFADARPRLGISVDAQQSARRDAAGAMVTDVLEDGPADRAGIRRGDVITAIDGRSLFEPIPGDAEAGFDLDGSIPVQRLLAIAAELEPGQRVEVEYERDGEDNTVTLEAEDLTEQWGSRPSIAMPFFDSGRLRGQLRNDWGDRHTFEFRSDEMRELGERARAEAWRARERAPGADVRVFGAEPGSGVGPSAILDRFRGFVGGLELIALNPELGSYFGVEEGVLVADVDENSTLGLEPGDVVLQIGEREVTTPDRMRRILGSYAEDEEITLRIRRDGRDMTVTGRLGR